MKFSGELGQGRKSHFQLELEQIKRQKSEGKNPYKNVDSNRNLC